jgi:hypothetical protein
MSSPVGPSIQYPESPGVLDTSAVSKVCSSRLLDDGVVLIGTEGCMYCTRQVTCIVRYERNDLRVLSYYPRGSLEDL